MSTFSKCLPLAAALVLIFPCPRAVPQETGAQDDAAQNDAAPAGALVAGALPQDAAQRNPAAEIQYPPVPDNDGLVYSGPIVLPRIARFNELPKRMYLEPDLSLPSDIWYLGDDFPATFGRLLDENIEAGLQTEAAYGLRRIGSNKMADVSSHFTDMRQTMNSSSNRGLQQACALTLARLDATDAAPDLLKFCRPESEVVCQEVESALARWRSPVAVQVWQQRIQNSGDYSALLIRLACEGLAALDDADSVPTLKTLLEQRSQPYPVRHAAASALASLAQNDAAELAGEYQTGGVPERLLATALLGDAQSDAAVNRLHSLCADESLAVAAKAWETMSGLHPERLIDRLPEGRKHPEANVRFVTIRMLQRFPSAQHCEFLQLMLADIHIGVRNAARVALTELADSKPELRDGILQQAGRALTDNRSNWQQLEQSLLVLGQLRHPAFQADCVRLLSHDKAEVMVTAAWVLHLMPRHELSEQIAAITLEHRRIMLTKDWPPAFRRGIQEHTGFLFQHAALTRQRMIYDLAKEQFNKKSGYSYTTRAAGLYAMGSFEEGNPDEQLIAMHLERIFDSNPIEPEDDHVRMICVLAIGRMNGRNHVEDLKRAHERFSTHSIVGQAVRHVMPLIGGPEMPTPKNLLYEYGFWKLAPVRDSVIGAPPEEIRQMELSIP